MKKRDLALLLTGVMAMPLLAGCGSSGTTETSGAEGSVSETQATAAAGEEVTLTVFDCMAYGLEGYEEVIKAFEAAYPGVTISVQHAANDGNTILKSRFNSGDIPDVFAVEPGSSAQDYYEYAYDWSGDTDILGKFKEGSTDLGTDTTDGKIKGLPWTYENMGLIYNKESFEKAGITALPTTLDELAADCEKLQAAGIQPFAVAGKETWVLGQLMTHFMMDKSLDAEGTVAAIKSGERKAADIPHMDNFFKLLDLIRKYDSNKLLETDWETSENDVANGEAAILHMGDWAQANFTKFNPDSKLAFLPVPTGDGEDDCTLLSSVGWVYLVNKDSKNLDIARKYVDFILTSEEAQKWMTEDIDGVPCAESDMEPVGDLPKDAQTYIDAGKTNGWIHTILSSDYGDTVGPLIQGYLGETMTKDEVIQGIQDYFDSIAE